MAIEKKINKRQRTADGIEKESERERPFTKVNFWMMGTCLVLIIVGFMLMSGGGSASDYEFNPEIFSTRRIVVGPLLSFLGFLLMAFAIIWTPRKKKQDITKENGMA